MPDPRILLCPNIPKPLHGIAPRVIMGKYEWDIERQKAYKAANYRCQACGVPKDKAKLHKWLEAHEWYEYDYYKGIAKFTKLVALCHYCHNFIHSGRLAIMHDNGEITDELYDAIINHGMHILEKADLVDEWEARHDHMVDAAPWEKWKMLYDGKYYGPSTKSFEEWSRGKWRNYKFAKIKQRTVKMWNERGGS